MKSHAEEVLLAARELSDTMSQLVFEAPVAYTYNPLEYAWGGHEAYVRAFVRGEVDFLFLGMNPGPFGMAQTGVPFGEIPAVADWMGLNVLIGQPTHMHPKRPIQGFGCPRSEVSGRRLWGLMAEMFGTAEQFFARGFVANFCPLIWMSESGSNITPDKLPKQQQLAIDAACQVHLRRLIEILKPRCLIGVGAYALKQFELAAQSFPEHEMTLGTILHPSPASPIANKQWPERPRQQLLDIAAQAGLSI